MIKTKCNECSIVESDYIIYVDGSFECSKIKGPTGSCVTDNYIYAANTIGSQINIISEGTNILLPNEQKIPSEYASVDESNEIFTIKNAGTYFIKYNIYTTSKVSYGSRLMINGVENSQSVVNYGLSKNKFCAEVILTIENNTQVSLQMFGTGTVILLNNGTGASLSIIRLA